ncbi:MAG: hypothetical protein U9N85_11325, partial [Bacteroidota bacterium]|nr:hypothetical protein [Bacteroidota bacterium]
LGITLFEMLTGRLPYNKELSEWELSNSIVFEPLPPIKKFYPHVSDKLQKIVDKATAKDKEQRFNSCSDFKEALVKLQNSKDTSVTPPINPPHNKPEKKSAQPHHKAQNQRKTKPKTDQIKQTNSLYTVFLSTYFGALFFMLIDYLIEMPAILGLLSFFASFVLSLIILYKAWSVIKDGETNISPGAAVGYLFIPVFNFYWIFIAFRQLFIETHKYNSDLRAKTVLPTFFSFLVVLTPVSGAVYIFMMKEGIYYVPMLTFISSLLNYILFPILYSEIKNNTIFILKHGKK